MELVRCEIFKIIENDFEYCNESNKRKLRNIYITALKF